MIPVPVRSVGSAGTECGCHHLLWRASPGALRDLWGSPMLTGETATAHAQQRGVVHPRAVCHPLGAWADPGGGQDGSLGSPFIPSTALLHMVRPLSPHGLLAQHEQSGTGHQVGDWSQVSYHISCCRVPTTGPPTPRDTRPSRPSVAWEEPGGSHECSASRGSSGLTARGPLQPPCQLSDEDTKAQGG